MAKPERLQVETEHGKILVHFRRREKSDSRGMVAALFYDFCLKGKRYRGPTGTLNLEAAKTIARNAVETATGKLAVNVTGRSLSIKNAVKLYLDTRWPEGTGKDDKRKGNRTYQDHKSRLATFEALCGGETELVGMPVANAVEMVNGFMAKRKAALEGRGGNYVRTQINDRLVLSSFFGWLISERTKHGISWLVNPVAKGLLKKFGPDQKEEAAPLDDEQLTALLTVAKTDADRAALWPVIVLCLGVGARPAEASRVTWGDLDFVKCTVRLLNKKGDKWRERFAALSSWAADELKAFKPADAADADKVFPHNYFVAFDFMAGLRKAYNLADAVTLQALRQTACTRAIEAEPPMPLDVYTQQFGHSLAVAQRHYIKYGKKAQLKKLAAVQVLDFGSMVKQA